MSFLKKILNRIDNFTLLQFIFIGFALFALCWYLFPDRVPALIALPVRMYIATLFVYTLYWIDEELDKQAKPWLICAGFLAAGFSL